MTKLILRTALAACLFSGLSVAGEVNNGQVTTFVPNTTAKASEMNTTINALISAINDNASRIAALEGTVSADNNLTGAIFCVYDLNNSVEASNSPGYISVATGPMLTRLEFLDASNARTTEVSLTFVSVTTGEGGLDVDTEVFDPEDWSYTVDANKVVTLTRPGDQLVFRLALDNRLVVGTFSETEQNASEGNSLFDAVLAVGVRVANSSACD